MIEKDPFFEETPETPEEQGGNYGPLSRPDGATSQPTESLQRRRESWWSAWSDPGRMRGAVMAALYAGGILLVADHVLADLDYYIQVETHAAAVCASGKV